MALGRSGSLVFVSSGSRLVGLALGESGGPGRPFVYDCAAGAGSVDGPSEDGGSDGVVAYAFSPLGTYVAVIADNKQLLLFRTRPWECLSVRSAVRRSTSLTITGAEDRILLADKSGDVYSFSISEPHRPGKLQLGHLSMLLAVAVSPDDRFVITADRDEKIRVSLLERPFVIVAFCLGHREFVSALLIPPNHPRLLVSGSGDGTVRLWEYENGKELDCFQLSEAQPSPCQTARCAVVRIVHCRRGDFFAVLCDGFSSVHVLELDVETQRLVYRQTIAVKRRAWDVAFDDCAGLWILAGDMAVLYQLQEGQWQKIPDHPERVRIEEVIRANWAVFQGSAAELDYSNLYKMSLDTMIQYRVKKELRIHQRQTKRELELGKVTGDRKRTRVGDAAM